MAKKSTQTKVELQYNGKNVSYDDIQKRAKEYLANEAKDLDIKNVDLYIRPEENRVYVVADGKELGPFEL